MNLPKELIKAYKINYNIEEIKANCEIWKTGECYPEHYCDISLHINFKAGYMWLCGTLQQKKIV
jgi:hypothetical protein